MTRKLSLVSVPALLIVCSTLFAAQEPVVLGCARPGDGSAVAKAWEAFRQKIEAANGASERTKPTFVVKLQPSGGKQSSNIGDQALAQRSGVQYLLVCYLAQAEGDWLTLREFPIVETNAILLEELNALRDGLKDAKQQLTPAQEQKVAAAMKADFNENVANAWKAAARNTKDLKGLAAFAKAAISAAESDVADQSRRNQRLCLCLTPQQMKAARQFLNLDGGNNPFAQQAAEAAVVSGSFMHGETDCQGGSYTISGARSAGKTVVTIAVDMKVKEILKRLVRDASDIFKTQLAAPNLPAETLEKQVKCEFVFDSAATALTKFAEAASIKLKETGAAAR